MLKELYIRVYRDEKRPSFQFYTGGVEQLYLLYLGKAETGPIKIINLYFTNQEYKIVNNYGSVIELNVPFDFIMFEEQGTNLLKKRMILNTLHWGVMQLATAYNWDNVYFESSYQKCIQANLSYSWFFKNKLFKSPNGKHYFGMWHLVDIGEYEIWEVLFDENKSELNKRRCFKDNVCVFFISYASWERENDHFFYRFNGPKKKFVSSVDDIIANKQIDISKDSSSFFK